MGRPRKLRPYNLATERPPPDSVYCGRGKGWNGRWGNPYSIGQRHPETGRFMTRDAVCDLYEPYILGKIERGLLDLTELEGRNLICWCWPERCHCLFLIKIANTQQQALFEEEPELVEPVTFEH